MGDFLQDLRSGLRQLAGSPGLSAAAVLCVAIGIGANTATFSFATSLLLYRPAVREPERLVRLFIRWRDGLQFGSWSYPDYLDLRARQDLFAGIVAETPVPVHLSHDGANERIWGSLVSGNYFSELGVEPALGRGFLPEEDVTPGTHPVVVISHRTWRGRFGSDPDVIGREVLLSGGTFTVIGVGPPGFHGTNVGFGPEVWVPIAMHAVMQPGMDVFESRGSHWIGFMIGRLAPGVGIEQARQGVESLMATLAEEYPDSNTGKGVDVYAETEAGLHPMVRGAFAAFIGLMFGVVTLVLLLACANVAGLLLARSAARAREIGVRLCLGAGRVRLLRQLLTESALLAVLAGAVGVLLGYWLIRLVETFEEPTDLPLYWEIGLDGRVLLFTVAATVISVLLFGLAPALQLTRQDLVGALKEGGPTSGARASLLRRALVAGQVGLSLILLVVSALLVRSLQNVENIDVGFDPDPVAIASIDLDLQGYSEAEGRQFQRQLEERLRALPGVASVGYAALLPLNLSVNTSGVLPEGYEVPEGSNRPSIDVNVASADYFTAMGIPIVSGRVFTERDDAEAPPVIVVNETFAGRFWPGQTAVGKRVHTGGRDYEVIGVVGDGKYFSIAEDPKPYFYHSAARMYRGSFYVHVRTSRDPAALIEPLRSAIHDLDPTLPVADLKTMNDALGFATLPARLAATVVSAFAALALLLAAVGIYGVLAYSVTRRGRDIGVRMALGARGNDVVRLVVGRGMRLTAVGIVAGLFGGLAATRLATAVLYDVDPADPVPFLAGAMVLGVVALLACWLPARRATRVDPIAALRSE